MIAKLFFLVLTVVSVFVLGPTGIIVPLICFLSIVGLRKIEDSKGSLFAVASGTVTAAAVCIYLFVTIIGVS